MKCEFIYDESLVRDCIDIVDRMYGIHNVMPDLTVNDIIHGCWVYALISDDEQVLYTLVFLDWTDNRQADIHFATIRRTNVIKAFKMVCASASPYVDELSAYIPLDRPDVVKIASRVGFNVKKHKGYHHGKFKPDQETQSCEATKT